MFNELGSFFFGGYLSFLKASLATLFSISKVLSRLAFADCPIPVSAGLRQVNYEDPGCDYYYGDAGGVYKVP